MTTPSSVGPVPRRRAGSALALLLVFLLAGCAGAPLSDTSWEPQPPWSPSSSEAPSSASTVGGDGRIADGERVNAFDTDHPAVANLVPELRTAVQQATEAASENGITILLNAGWRSRALQQRLLEEAIRTYGSRAEALRWVATPDSSKHVTGEAVDVAGAAAADWLERHGRTWRLCRTYLNESWHFELATTPGGTCPRMRPDARS